MKILQMAIRNFSTFGIDWRRQDNQNNPLNCRSALAFLVLSLSTISCAMYFFRLASTFADYTFSIFGFSSMFVATAIMLVSFFVMEQCFHAFNALEDAINERKQHFIPWMSLFYMLHAHILGLQYPASQRIYNQINPEVEKWCELIYFANMRVFFPVGMSLEFIFGFAMYFTTDLGNDAFAVPLPFW